MDLEGLTTPRPLKRKPVAGDVVRSISSGRTYLVTEVGKDFYGHIMWIGVDSLENGLPNAFREHEVTVCPKREAKQLLATSTTAKGGE
jgi:hypothetical protein